MSNVNLGNSSYHDCFSCTFRIVYVNISYNDRDGENMGMPEIMKKRRDELDLTLLDIAKEIGVSEATVQRYESGRIKNLRQDKIVKLASVLQLTPAQLLGWEDAQTQGAEGGSSPVLRSGSIGVKPPTTDSDEVIDLLEKIASLYEKGILTDEEYTGKKQELLKRL